MSSEERITKLFGAEMKISLANHITSAFILSSAALLSLTCLFVGVYCCTCCHRKPRPAKQRRRLAHKSTKAKEAGQVLSVSTASTSPDKPPPPPPTLKPVAPPLSPGLPPDSPPQAPRVSYEDETLDTRHRHRPSETEDDVPDTPPPAPIARDAPQVKVLLGQGQARALTVRDLRPSPPPQAAKRRQKGAIYASASRRRSKSSSPIYGRPQPAFASQPQVSAEAPAYAESQSSSMLSNSRQRSSQGSQSSYRQHQARQGVQEVQPPKIATIERRRRGERLASDGAYEEPRGRDAAVVVTATPATVRTARAQPHRGASSSAVVDTSLLSYSNSSGGLRFIARTPSYVARQAQQPTLDRTISRYNLRSRQRQELALQTTSQTELGEEELIAQLIYDEVQASLETSQLRTLV